MALRLAAAAGFGRFFQRTAQIERLGLQSGHEPHEEAARNRHRDGEDRDARVEAGAMKLGNVTGFVRSAAPPPRARAEGRPPHD